MRKIILFFIGFSISFGLVRAALGDGSGTPTDAGVVAVDAGSAVTPTVAVPDPVADPGASLTLVEKLYKSGAIVDVGILLTFFLLTLAAKKIAWLKEDHRAVIVAAILGGLALLAVPAAAGTTPNLSQILGALVVAIGLAVNPKKAAEQ